MTLSWTKEQKDIAKEKQLGLFKVQVQTKYCNRDGTGGGANFQTTGTCSEERGLAMFLLSCIPNEDPRVAQILALLKE